MNKPIQKNKTIAPTTDIRNPEARPPQTSRTIPQYDVRLAREPAVFCHREKVMPSPVEYNKSLVFRPGFGTAT